MQSFEWGNVRKNEGKTVVRFGEYDKSGTICAVYAMTIHPIPFTGCFIGYIPKSTLPSKELIAYLKSYARSNRLVFVKFEPNSLHGSTQNGWMTGLVKSAHPLFTPWNQLLDIAQPEDELLKKMHSKTRYNVRLAEKKGVRVQLMNNDEGYAIFEKLYFETCARQKYHGHTRTYHRNIWTTLNDSLVKSFRSSEFESADDVVNPRVLRSHILVAFYQDIPLAAYQLWQFNDVLYYVYGGSSEEHKNVMAPNLLMWETIKLAKRLGCHTLDMWGSLAPNFDPKDPWAGFTKFKQGYGTTFVQYAGSFDLVGNRLLYRLYSYAQAIRQRFFL
ncbi:peptidoglycan bridge formation glycyltransferase FemA/FemB family protein [Candidatus Woesebacteria bacterium]|nr:peptidoglycan bridge formation glycyltransferase FemA/FemB family protein [Candidatus Woesebacteria bacterium]